MRKVVINSMMLALISFMSCKEFKLSKEDLKWQPYQVDDILVFESNLGEVDSIKIMSIDSYINPKDPLAVFPDQYEVLFVKGKLLNPNEEDKQWGHVNFLNLTSGNETWINFNLSKISDSLTYADSKYSIDELNSFYKEEKMVNNCIDDVIKLNPNFTGELDHEYDLKFYLWSYQFGYVQYNFKNGYYRELKKFIRNGRKTSYLIVSNKKSRGVIIPLFDFD